MFDYLALLNNLSNALPQRKSLALLLKLFFGRTKHYSLISYELGQSKRIQRYLHYIRARFGISLEYYDPKEWFSSAIYKEGFTYFWKNDYLNSSWYQFMEAVKEWQRLCLREFHEKNCSVAYL